MVNKNKNKIKTQIKLLSQGSYGCVYKPNINCSGNIAKSNNYVTKLQLNNYAAKNEIAIDNKLLTIPNYNLYFAPILNTCPIQLAKINRTYIEKCDIVTKNKDSSDFVLSKIKFVGSQTLESYIVSRINNSFFIPKFLETHSYLLYSLQLLADNNIIHKDIKENNIIYDTKNQVPIFIDFGLSIDATKLIVNANNANNANNAKFNTTIYSDAFNIYYDKYPPWSLDIVINSYIVNKYKDLTSIVIVNDLITSVRSYFNNNEIVKIISKLIPKKVVTKYLSDWEIYINTFENKSGKYIIDTITTYWKTWDNCGLSVLFLFIWYNYNLQSLKINTKYQTILIDQILSIPSKRISILDTKNNIDSLLSNLDITSYNANITV